MLDNRSFVVATLKNYLPGLDDQVFNQRPGWWWLKTNKKRIKGVEGGLNISQKLSVTKNSSVAWRGAKETIPLPEQNPLKEIAYAWKHLTGGLPIYKDDERRNRGKSALIDWATTLIENFTETYRDMMGPALYAAGGQGVLDGLAAICSKTNIYPTADDEQQVPGINRATAGNEWWQANVLSTVEAWSLNGGTDKGWAKGYWLCSNGSEHPDLFLVHPDIYDKYEASLLPNQRFTNPKAAEAGFENLAYKGATVIPDEDAGDGNTYILTTSGIWIRPDTLCESGLIIDPRHPLETVRADRILAEWVGNITCSRPNRQCLISGKS